MTTQQQKDFIRAKCIEANPSIKDLVFGCKISFSNEIWNYVCHGKAYDGAPTLMLIGVDGSSVTNIKKDVVIGGIGRCKYEIIGRDIRLADVLLAIEKQVRDNLPNNLEYLSNSMEYLWGCAKDLIHNWELEKDNLDDQTPETIEFIYQLLK